MVRFRGHIHALYWVNLIASDSFHLSLSGKEDASEPIKDASGFRVVSKPLVLQKTYRLDYNIVNVFIFTVVQ